MQLLTSARGYLDRLVFVPAPERRLTPTGISVAVAWVAVGAALVLLRAWSADPLHHLYSEDSYVYLAHAQGGIFGALLDSYNGYVQVSSRAVAGAVAYLPVGWWAAAMAVGGALIVSCCALVVWVASGGHIRDPWLRGALAAAVVLFGAINGEMLGNVVNTIWFTSFACFWLLLWRPRGTAAGAFGGALLLIGTLSHSAPLFFLPIWLLRASVVRSRADALIVAGFAAGAILQLALSYDDIGPATHVADPIPAGAPFSSRPYWDWNLVPAFGQRIVGSVLGGQDANAFLWRELGLPYLLALTGLYATLIVSAWRTRGTRLLVLGTAAIALTVFLFSGYVRWGAGGDALHWPAGSSTQLGGRYVYLPGMLLLSAVLIQCDALLRAVNTAAGHPRLWLRTVPVALLALLFVVDFQVTALPELGPRWGVAVERARATCIAGGSETVQIVATSTIATKTVPVACSRLR